MRTSRLAMLMFAVLCCLLMSQRAQAQNAYGYASIVFDESTNTVTGYASTDVDYDTAYYYDAEVQAQIQDENGNILASGTAAGNPSAFTVLDVFQALLCIRFSIISYVIATPRFLGCNGGYYDYWGFSDFWWGDWWDYGGFFGSRENRCIFNRLIFIATIIADVINCLPAEVRCTVSSTRLLPSGLRAIETNFLLNNIPGVIPGVTNRSDMTISCRATDQFNQPQSGLLIRFGFGNNVRADNGDGGHRLHSRRGVAVARPKGTLSRTSMRTNNDGVATSVYTAPVFGGSTEVVMSAEGTNGSSSADIFSVVPGLEALPPPVGNAGYILTGSSENGNTYHPNGHYGTPQANTSLQNIGIAYRNRFFPETEHPNGVPIESVLKFNDQSLVLGGKFDITPDFNVLPAPSYQAAGSHDEHRVGINCDVSTTTVPNNNVVIDGVTRNRRRVVEEIFASNGSTRTLREFRFSHWHLRFEYGTTANTSGATSVASGQLPAVGSAPANGTPPTMPGTIQAEMYDNSGEDGTPGSFVPGGGGEPGIIVYNYPQVLPINLNDGNNYVPTAGSQWMNYTVNVASSGSYTFEARVASPSSWNTFHIEVDGVNVTGSLSIPNTGSEVLTSPSVLTMSGSKPGSASSVSSSKARERVRATSIT